MRVAAPPHPPTVTQQIELLVHRQKEFYKMVQRGLHLVIFVLSEKQDWRT